MKRVIVALALLLAAMPLAISTAAAQSDPHEQMQRILQEALGQLRAGQPAKAVELVDPVLARFDADYGDEKRHLYCGETQQLAIIYAAMNAQDDDHRDTLVLDSGWCSALWVKGFALIDLGRPQEALSYFQRAVDLSPYYPQYLIELGYSYKELKQWDQSAAAYRRAAAVAPMGFEGDQLNAWYRRAWYGEAFAYIEQGRWAEAEALLRKCLEVAPGDQKVLSELQYIADNRDDGK
ncbi:tetratricopeptide repeat protein [Sphingosinithalassobacter portus]|uniref:tetratricopeptide repeat protein n=1 Tax=Stakelama portus TaxID=2676234 RepID=UPI000D6E15F4|nr:tetratricopeptide repeat protein [Sphingosinithalassobacter portus]